jgi:protein-tyrosine-phosphatase
MNPKVLFLCPHNAAKSVIAAAYFNRMAQTAGLNITGASAGTEPSAAVSPVVAAMMSPKGLDVSRHQPRRVTADELQTAALVISIGCTPEELGETAAPIVYWDDVPMVSHDAEGSRAAIQRHVTALVEALRVSQG